ncbi:MAG: hypothetical protein J6S60_06030 [Oscillospiraceae bacterium]|nr:hypothetical protein [Oscillospiraceae bacterium]
MDERVLAAAALAQATAKVPGTMPLIGAARNQPEPEMPVGKKQIDEATETLRKYKAGKSMLEQRVVEDELWWELRHWEAIGRNKSKCGKYQWPEPSSAWLFNTILNKHADVMDNYPEPIVLPREESDRQSAKLLSEILPVVMENSGFGETYSDNAWEKLKHGTAVYGVFWNSEKDNGLGDIDIRGIDLLRVFWEPGITDIQKSRNLYIVDLVDTELLDEQYPEYRGRFGGKTIDVKEYYFDETVDNTQKSVVVDWYYKVRRGGRTVLHYAKFCGNVLLYASENEPEYAERGYYDHGLYPVVFDTLFPEKGTPAGFGYVAVTKSPQLYIDRLSANILQSSMMATKKRFFVSTSTNVSPEQFADWNQQIVPVEGELSDSRIQEIQVAPISGVYLDVLQQKIEELKDTAGNRDVNSGGVGGGVTAAAAIAALQEAGNKTSRDLIAASYRAHTGIASLCIELMRQFYDEARAFRIAGPGAEYQFVEFSGAMIREQPVGVDAEGNELYRKPVFDLKIKAQKRNPFSTMEANERAKELYGMGFFDPNRAQEAAGALEMMEFEGKDQVEQRVQQGQTLLNVVQQMSQQMQQMAAMLGMGTATPAASPTAGGQSAAPGGGGMADRMTRETMKANTPMTGYGQRLAQRSTPEVSGN